MTAALAASSLTPTDCPASSRHDQIECFRAVLPLNINAPENAKVVDLLVARVDNGDPFGVGPVMFFQGGPGLGSVARLTGFVGGDHDLVFFDQRGSGGSRPKLDCPEVEALWDHERTDDSNQRLTDDEIRFEAYEQCVDRLRTAGIDLDAFHTSAVAADAELLRRLFEIEEWSVWGISYGTRVALTMMRNHPGGLRAAVLDSVVPFEVDFFASIPTNAMRAFEALDDACDIDACADDHGDFLDNLSQLVVELDSEPAVVSVTRPVSGDPLQYRVAGSDLLDLVFTQLYSTRRLTSLPRQVARADFGGLDELVTGYVQRRDPEQFDLSIALYYTTWCREEVPFHDPTADDDFVALMAERYGPAFSESLESYAIERLCSIFDVKPAQSVDDEPLEFAVPTIPAIVFAGAFDPITPPEWSRRVADALGATYIEMSDHGHGMSTSCPLRLRSDFLNDPNAALDLACVAQAGPPDFD